MFILVAGGHNTRIGRKNIFAVCLLRKVDRNEVLLSVCWCQQGLQKMKFFQHSMHFVCYIVVVVRGRNWRHVYNDCAGVRTYRVTS